MTETADSSQFPPGIDYVLTSTVNGNDQHYHRAAADQSDEPACGRHLTTSTARWRRRTHPRQVLFYDACEECSWPTGGLD